MTLSIILAVEVMADRRDKALIVLFYVLAAGHYEASWERGNEYQLHCVLHAFSSS